MPDNREELKVYRLEMAKERLHSSKILLEAGSYKDSIGRSYYAMFTAVRALLAVEGQDFSKHAGVIAYFQKEYVKTGKFDKKYSKYAFPRGLSPAHYTAPAPQRQPPGS